MLGTQGIFQLLERFNIENGSNYKIALFKTLSNNELLKRVFSMTYDKVKYTYGITMKNITYPSEFKGTMSLESALDFMEQQLCTRKVTGNAAHQELSNVLSSLSYFDYEVISRVLSRDLKINFSTSNMNKVVPDLISKVPYMRCETFSKKALQKISFPAIVQLKADGLFQMIKKQGDDITFVSRSGEYREFSLLKELLQADCLKDGYYIGEMTVMDAANRAEGNGMINSKDPDHSKIIFQAWDFLTPAEFSKFKAGGDVPYIVRFEMLQNMFKNLNSPHLSIIPFKMVNDITEVFEYTSEQMSNDLEGAVLKDLDNIFKDGTSKSMLKIKLEVDTTVRITGFTPGKPGSKREATFGSIEFCTDDGKVEGRASGINDKDIEMFHSNREFYIGKLMDVTFNDLSLARNSEIYSLSHPRFKCLRTDITDTDTIERIKNSIEMSKELK